MFQNLKESDSYYKGRVLEARARRENSPELWLEFASIKKDKGSYALASMGFLNAGILFESVGNVSSSLEAYENGFAISVKGELKETALLIGSRIAALAERDSDFIRAASVYEKLGSFFEAREAFFLAADAYEHAAEMFFAGGKDISSYRKPADLWLRNAEYWVLKGDAGDEAWSRKRAELYLELARGKK